MATDFTEIKRTQSTVTNRIQKKKLNNLDEMNKYLETHNPPNSVNEETENRKTPITSNEI